MTFRKNTVVQVGTSGGPWVPYNGVWVAEVDGGMLSIPVMNHAGPKEDIQGWRSWTTGRSIRVVVPIVMR